MKVAKNLVTVNERIADKVTHSKCLKPHFPRELGPGLVYVAAIVDLWDMMCVLLYISLALLVSTTVLQSIYCTVVVVVVVCIHCFIQQSLYHSVFFL